MEYINLIITAIILLGGVVGALIGLRKGLFGAILRGGLAVVALLVAFGLTPALAEFLQPKVQPLMDKLLVSFAEVLEASPTLKDYIPTVLQKLVAPLTFVGIFVLCLVVASVVRLVLSILLKKLLSKKGLVSRLLGVVVLGVCGVMVSICFVFPITGYFANVSDIYADVKQSGVIKQSPLTDKIDQVMQAVPEQSAVKNINKLTGKYFDKLVSYQVDEQSISIFSDVKDVTALIPPAKQFAGGVSDVKTMDLSPIYDITQHIGQNVKLRNIVAEILSTAATKWQADQAFLGINLKSQLDEEYRFALDGVLEDLSKTTEETVVDDLNKLADTIQTIQHIYLYIDMLNGNATLADLENQLYKVLISVDDHTVDLIHDLVTGDVLADMGIPNADIVASVIGSVVDNAVASANDNQLAKDAKAINNIMHFVNNDSQVSATDVIESIVDSPVITGTFNDLANAQTPPALVVKDEAQKQQIVDALSTVEDEQLVQSLKTLFGI